MGAEAPAGRNVNVGSRDSGRGAPHAQNGHVDVGRIQVYRAFVDFAAPLAQAAP